jgi:acyl carrier protein
MLQDGGSTFCREGHLPATPPSESEICEWCLDYMRRTVEDAAVEIGTEVPFAQMGLDSATSAYFIVELEEWLGDGIELEPEVVFDYPTIAALTHYIVGRRDGGA